MSNELKCAKCDKKARYVQYRQYYLEDLEGQKPDQQGTQDEQINLCPEHTNELGWDVEFIYTITVTTDSKLTTEDKFEIQNAIQQTKTFVEVEGIKEN